MGEHDGKFAEIWDSTVTFQGKFALPQFIKQDSDLAIDHQLVEVVVADDVENCAFAEVFIHENQLIIYFYGIDDRAT